VRLPLYLLAVVALDACVTAPAPPHPAPPPPAAPSESPSPADLEQLSQQVEQGRHLAQDQQFAQADELFNSVIAAPAFDALPPVTRHTALQLGGVVALEMRDPQRSLALLRRACEMTEADVRDWYMRVRAGNAAQDPKDTVAALTVLATRWPQALPRLEPYHLDFAMHSLEAVGSDADRDTVLTALFGVHLSEEHNAASNWWRDLALLRLARGDSSGAMGALLRVTDPYVAIGVEVDRRFDPMRYLIEAWPGVPEVARRAIEAAAQRTQANPGKVEPMARLALLLRHSLRYPESLQVADSAIERQDAGGPGTYSDYDREYTWILDARAYALFATGRWDAAIIQEQAASNLPERGGANVSQVINLADMYVRVGKAAESLATLKRLAPGRASRFGDMQAQSVKVLAAVQLHDAAAVDAALTFLRQHRDDAPSALQEALLAAGRDDEGAKLLISRLADPRLRDEALLDVQEYDAAILSAWDEELHRRWLSLIGRRDVQAAVAKVGRVSHYPLERNDPESHQKFW
jgi:tetratricopeptide (TPR) repeat protein